MGTDYYELLGVSREASEAEIKQAYRDRIKETHPDVSDDETAHEHTKRLIEAKEVLTDETERRRYDRLGHEAYVGSSDESTDTATTKSGSRSQGERRNRRRRREATASTGSRQADGGESRQSEHWQAGGRSTNPHGTGGSTARNDTGASADWYDAGSGSGTEGAYRAWDSERAYAVGDEPGMFEPAELLSSQRTVVLLGTTFVIYPVLLFGALFPPFPTVVNVLVAMCIVLVIAFLQSMPRIGMFVFGTWTVLLPIGLFGVVGVRPFTFYGVLATAAVWFPFGLSILTWIAIRPMRR